MRALPAACIGLLILLTLTASKAPAAEDAPRPNIIVILCDDMGYSDLGSYGATRIETPNLDRLAEDGLRFTRFYNNAKCSQTRASLLSGLYWQQTRNLRRDNHITLAEGLKSVGYNTMAVGKWHVGRWGGPDEASGTPTQRGFDRYYGFLGGCINFFTGVECGGATDTWRRDGEPIPVPGETEEGFYATRAFTDQAIDYVDEAAQDDNPFFLYLAYNAPHYPLHAPEETIEKYRGRFRDGWEALRKERFQKMQELGIVSEEWDLSPPNATPAPQYPEIPEWDELSKERRWSEDLKMAVYAAMIDEMDRGIGRLMKKLDRVGEKDNTLVLFLSDNGGCPFIKTRTPNVAPGPAESFHNYETPWANASNTPFRGYKRQNFEGGSATPMIAHWPEAIEGGRVTDRVGHLIDFMPTLMSLAGAEYPSEHDGHKVLPMEGETLVPTLTGAAESRSPWREAPLFWEHRRHAAMQQGPWKLVAQRKREWTLHDMRSDRTEMHDLSEEKPERFERMKKQYAEWADRVGARMPQNQ
jgi:arylsulfatase